WDADVVPSIVHSYTREAGVRELERRVGRVSRKLARKRAEARDLGLSTDPVSRAQVKTRVRASDLRDLLGIAPYDPSLLNLDPKIGVATGLAYTSVGGEVLEIEVSAIAGRGKLQLTGTLGDVMKESASAALSFARARATTLGIDRDFHRHRDLPGHIPSRGTPEDGPSAGL